MSNQTRKLTEASPAPSRGRTSEQASQPITEPQLINLDLAQIKVDQEILARAELNQAVVDDYAERMEAGDKFPALAVFHVEDSYLLADGQHRYFAADKLKRSEFLVKVYEGTRADAIQYAVGANAKHGLPRTNADKRHAVEVALKQFGNSSDGVIAQMCKVSQPFVSNVRRQLKTVMSSAKRTGLDGKKRGAPAPRVALANQPVTEEVEPDQPTTKTKSPSAKLPVTPNDEPTSTATPGTEGFDLNAAWAEIEAFLLTELDRWPLSRRSRLGDMLRKFADSKCD